MLDENGAKSKYTAGGFRLKKKGEIWHIAGTKDGRRYRMSTKTDDPNIAMQRLHGFVNEVDSGWRDAATSCDWVAVAGTVWKRHRFGATKRGIPFSITMAEVYGCMKATSFLCAVSGVPFSMSKARQDAPDPWGPSIDRIQTRQGYVPGNIRVVSLAANLAMNQFGYDTLLRLAMGVVRSSRPVPEPGSDWQNPDIERA